MFKNVKKIFSTSLGKQLLYYCAYSSVLWGLHLVIISIISFFHFLLDHNIRVIGEWVADRGWQIIILSKILIFYLATLFINLKLSKTIPIRLWFRNHQQFMRIEIFTCLVFLLFAVLGVGGASLNKTMLFEIDRVVLSVVGTFVFFATDYLIIALLDYMYPLKEKKDKLLRVVIFPALFYFFSAITFKYEQTISLKLYAFFLLLMYLGQWKRINWSYPCSFLLFFIIPICSFIGHDPVWGEIYSPLVTKLPQFSTVIFTLVIICIVYLEIKKNKKPEYIYRD